ncbi:MAG: PIN domain-containing protein [bacterium]|nr:PIN domain-containing protein [bacterium]
MLKCIDTSILLAATDTTHPLHARAVKYLKGCAAEPWVTCVCYESLASWAEQITSSANCEAPLKPSVVQGTLDAMLKRREPLVLYGDEQILKRALKLVAKHAALRDRVPEALTAATALAHGVNTLVTSESAPYQAIRELTVENPFETLFA